VSHPISMPRIHSRRGLARKTDEYLNSFLNTQKTHTSASNYGNLTASWRRSDGSPREYKSLSLANMEKRTGLFRYDISRIENGHAMPTLETLGRLARALDVPVFHLAYEEGDAYPPAALPENMIPNGAVARLPGRELRILERFNQLVSRLSDRNRRLLFDLARKMVKRIARHPSSNQTTEGNNQMSNLGSWPSARNARDLNTRDGKRTHQAKLKTR
jgi:transcriptional regulator with XRE-family HTH domain